MFGASLISLSFFCLWLNAKTQALNFIPDAPKISPETGWTPTPICHLRVCEFGRISCGFPATHHQQVQLLMTPLFFTVRIWSRVCNLFFTLSHLNQLKPFCISVMSGIITGPYFVSFFDSPNAVEVGSIVAVLEIGAFSMFIFRTSLLTNLWTLSKKKKVTSIAAGKIGDIVGRKGTLCGGAVLFTIGGLVQTFTVGVWSMILGRLVSGFGVGLLSWALPLKGLTFPWSWVFFWSFQELLYPYIRVRYPLPTMYDATFFSSPLTYGILFREVLWLVSNSRVILWATPSQS